MIVDLGHSAKRTDFVFFLNPSPRTAADLGDPTPATMSAIAFGGQTPKRVRVRWYFCPPGAKPIPGGSIWASTDWSNIYELAETTIGEMPRTGTSKGNRLGLAPIGVTGQRVCGKLIDFTRPKVWNPDAPVLKRGPSGVPFCCNPGLSGPVAFCGRSIAAGALGLTATIPPAEPAEAMEFTAFIPSDGDAEWGIASIVATIGLSDISPATGALILGVSSSEGTMGLSSPLPASGDVELYIASASADVGLDGGVPAAGDVVLFTGSGGGVGLIGEDPAGGDVVLGTASSDGIGLVGEDPAGGDVVLGTASYAAGDLGLVGEDPAAGDLGLVGEDPAAGDVVLGTASSDGIGLVGEDPADGELGLVGEDPAAGDVVLTTTEPPPVDPDAAVGLVGEDPALGELCPCAAGIPQGDVALAESGGSGPSGCFCDPMPSTLTLTVIFGCPGSTSPQTMTFDASGVHGAGWYGVIDTVGGDTNQWFLPCTNTAPPVIDVYQIANGFLVGPGSTSAAVCSPFDSGLFLIPTVGMCNPTTQLRIVE